MNLLRVYIDTSVFGGYFDMEFADSSRRFFDAVFNGVNLMQSYGSVVIMTPSEIIKIVEATHGNEAE